MAIKRPKKSGRYRTEGLETLKPIAIIGLAFRFPGDLSDEEALWQALQQRRDLVTEVPADRWATHELQHRRRAEPGRSITFSAGVLSKIDEFDAAFFGISPREAAQLDPQQRLLLELAWEAMENAAIPPSRLAGTDCAVYVGISSLDYGTRALDDLASMTAHSMTGNTLSIAANRISYVFDLHGPSLAVDTACSSSLVALHHACRALQGGEASTALVGGVSLLLHPYPFVGFTKASMLSAQGRCKVFDAEGNGYVRSEGAAVLLLKRLDQALADGDPIHAVILGTGVNADGGRKNALTIPSPAGQVELMRQVLAKTGLTAADVDFVEAHGTGTAVGDPIECAAIGQVYGRGRSDPLPIGSIKANLGHMEAASGMAGLIKTIVALKRRALPPQIHLSTPNPHIDFAALNVAPVAQPMALQKAGPLIAGVNSFGFGGANAHVLLQEWPAPTVAPTTVANTVPPLVLSAKNSAALRASASRYAALLAEKGADCYYDIAYAAAFRRQWLPERLALLPHDAMQAAETLAAFAESGDAAGIVRETALPQTGSLTFVYSGNGAQWQGMARQLMLESPAFAQALADLDARIQSLAGFSVLQALHADTDPSVLQETAIAQPLLFAIQIGLTQLLADLGVTPTAVVGHSVGEVAAAWAAGIFDLDTAARVIVARSRAQSQTRGTGRMAAAGLSAQEAQQLIVELGVSPQDIAIAGINSPRNITFSGSLAALERLQAALAARGVFFRILDLDYAFHSNRMDPIQTSLLDSLRDLQPRQATHATFVSTVTGDVVQGCALDADYWWRNVREPVRFAHAIAATCALGARIFIEIGPNAILQRYIKECLEAADVHGRVLPTLQKGADGLSRVRETALRAHLLSDGTGLKRYFPVVGQHVTLPPYPWQRERHWHSRSNESALTIERRRVHPLLGWPLPHADHIWENTLDPSVLPWLADHKVGGAVVFPGAAYAEMALAAAREWLGAGAFGLEEMDILAPLVFDEEVARTLRFELYPRDGSFVIKSRPRLSTDPWTLHASGRLLQPSGATSHARLARPDPRHASALPADAHYRLTAALGLAYGPAFRGLDTAWVQGEWLEAALLPPPDLDATSYLLHPALLDVCFQAQTAFFQAEIEAGQAVALLPVKLGHLTLLRSGVPLRFRARLVRRSARSVLLEFELFDADGQLLAQLSGCRFRAAALKREQTAAVAHWVIEPWLTPHPLQARHAEGLPLAELVAALSADAHTDVARRQRWFKETLPLLEALVVSFAFEAFRAAADRGNDALQRLVGGADAFTRWLADLLRQEGLLVARELEWQLVAEADLPAAADLWRTLLRDAPEAVAQLTWLGRIGQRLPDLLVDPEERQRLSATLAHSPALEDLFQSDPAYSGVYRATEQFLQHLARTLPPHRRLRILELGLGPSELPRTILPLLPEDRLEYTLAVAGDAAADRLRVEYAAHPQVRIAAFDPAAWTFVGTDPPGDCAFDVVLVRHILHRCLIPKAALTQVRRWLAAGAYLLVAERHPDWSADFLHGLDPAWWHAGPDAASPLSSLTTAENWQALLQQENFADVVAWSEPAAEGLAAGAYLILARSSAVSAAMPDTPAAHWQFLVDGATRDIAHALAVRLIARGQRAEVIETLEQVDIAARHLVWLKGWQASGEDAGTLVSEALALIQALTQQQTSLPRLWWLTRGAALASQPVGVASPNPALAALWGMVRVAMNEVSALSNTLIDVATATVDEATLQRLEWELLWPDGCEEIVLGNGGQRHALLMREAPAAASHAPGAMAHPRYRLDFHLPGQLRHLVWLPMPERALADEEVEVAVKATGLNFRDVMYVMGLLPDEALEKGFAGPTLGLEFSGVVQRVGPRVRDVKPGDAVMGFGSACFASHVLTNAAALAPLPSGWTFESAATVPTVFLTAYYALHHLAHLQAGERVLIHGGAGGVGIAAIQLAKHLGAEVFATAGSDEKRDFVRLLGADHVFDSRSLSFADDILTVTAGEGVDVVLNSLAGEAMRRSLRVLKPFGRFLELGKRDFFENTPIGLRPFKDNISYFGIDADQLLIARPQLAKRLFYEVMALFREGALSPLPARTFTAERVVDAFRTMQQARHIGKVVVTFDATAPSIAEPPPAAARLTLDPDVTWLITGGVSGFGLEAAQWLAERGARHLVLVGRRGLDTPGAPEAIAAFAARDVHAHVLACDITDRNAVCALIDHIRRHLPPLHGVLHAAAVFDDALIANLDAQRMQQVLAPKLIGAWHLHQATLDTPLAYFVLFSSVTTAIGNPGQANYVAANAGLESLALLRHRLGLPATCIAWGPIGDAGYLTRQQAVRDALAQRLGKPPLSAQTALEQLDILLSQQTVRTVANFDWSTLSRILPSARSRRFMALNRAVDTRDVDRDQVDFNALAAQLSPEQLTELVQKFVREEVAQVLAISADRIDPTHSLHDLGLDSLMAVELALGLERRLGIQLPVMMLNESPTVQRVTQRIVERLLGGAGDDTAANTLDAVAQGMAQQHGESVTVEELRQITRDARAMAKQGARLTA